MPAYAFASLPVAIALASLFRRGRAQRIISVALLALVIPWAIWQGSVANRVEQQEADSAASFQEVGLLIGHLSGGKPCAFLSAHGQPQIQYASGCQGARFSGAMPSQTLVAQVSGTGDQVFVVLGKKASADSPFSSQVAALSKGPDGSVWFVYKVSGSGG